MMEYCKWYWILLTVLFIGGGGLCQTEGCLEHERVALLQLKSFFNNRYDYFRDWVDVHGSNCCEWEMVKCSISGKRVIQLSLNYTRYYGHLNASLFRPFTELKTLYLNGNGITGFMENEAGFAKKGSAFKKLEILDLSENYYLDDSILTSLREISSLKSLYLSWNEITAGSNSFAKLASALRKLEILDLSGNQVNGSILTSLSEISSLRSLHLSWNKFSGSNYTNGIAKLSSALKNLEILDLSNNDLDGSMLSSLSELSSLKSLNLTGINEFRVSNHTNGFEWLSRLGHLETLDISGNKLNNDILLHVAALSSLKTLNLASNQLQGSVNIKELSRLRKLGNLDLSHNSLGSSIWGVVTGLSNLESLNLGGNQLTGLINKIKGWCDLWNLEELDVSGNALEGTVPPCFHNLSSLRLLDISYNRIRVPSSFIPFTNNSQLKFLFIDQTHLVRESTFQTGDENPKFQLKVLSMSNCATEGLPTELPNFVSYQYDLRYVDLSYNKFGGQYPSWLLENNTRLQQVRMVGNSFNGSLQLPKHANVELLQVDMSENGMQGQIPMNICSTFPQLERLSLSQNAFKGNIPSCLGGLKSLISLDLSFNNFSGGIILEKLAMSSSLSTLRLSNNNLSGKIPPTIFNSSMYHLYLDGNNFDGDLPLLDMSTVSSSILSDIDLSNNHLSGKIPRWIWNLPNLVSVVFSNNHFDGDRIPLELCNLGWLRFLDLSQNNLFGSVPSCFSSLTNLQHLYLSKNKLSGSLPRALYNSSSLVTLDLSHNNFTGKIPIWISNLSALRILLLKDNHFEGEIPSRICQLNSLSIIDLSQNKLFGQIPSCLSNLTLEPTNAKSFRTQNGVEFFPIMVLGEYRPKDSYPSTSVEEQVVFTTKKRLLTYSGNILDYMSGIDLSCNMLSGQIPSEIGNLIELRSMNLSHNELVGCIPSTLSKLKQVESLDISHNKLSGTIPIQLMELNSVAVFNVSYNNLSGSIPYEKAQFATFDENSYLGNPFLCGPPKHESCTKTNSFLTAPNILGNEEEESDLLDKQVFYVTFVISYTTVLITIGVVLYLNPNWRRAWLYFIQQSIDTCYYFIVDNVLGLSIFRIRIVN